MKCNAAMASVRLFFLLIVLALLTMSQASAATYSLTPGSTPISIPGNTPAALCSGNQGTWSGNTYTCTWDQPFSLQQGDVITSSAAVTIHSNNGMNLTNVTLGSSSTPITLTAESGRTIQLNNSVLYSTIGGGSTQDVVLTNNTTVHGSISVSGTIQSTNSTVMGNIASSSGAIQSTNSTVMGTITSSNGAVTFTGGQAFGHINVQCCKVTVSGGAVIHAGIRAGNNGIDISNSTVTGDLNAGSNPIVLTNVTMLSGNISAGSNDVTINGGDITANVTNANNVRISNGAVVHGKVQARYLVDANNSTIYGDIETTDNFPEGLHHVKLTDSTVYGNVTVRTDWGTIIGNWPDSAIYGDCDYQSVTPSLCQAGPPPISDPLWKFDEAQWNGNANEVIDSSVNLRHGIALNGANTAISNPSPASCTYGDFQRGSSSSNNPYVGIGRNSYFHSADNFSFSLWIRMNGADLPGTRQVILAYGADNGVNDEVYGRFELLRTSAGALRFAVRMENKNLRYVETTGNVFNGQWHHVAVSYSKTNRRMRLYVDNVLLDDVPDEPIGNGNPFNTPNDGNKGLSIGALPNGSNGIKGQIDEVRFLNFELTAAQVAAYAAETASCAVPDQCFIENFGSTTNWYPTTLNNSTAPSLQSSPSRLRLTTNAQNQSTAITFKRSFPALGNKMTIEFDYYGFGGSGADGVALVLSDATVTPSPGSYGGSLGYAQRNNGNSGFAGGWLGIGFDEFGNYQLPAEGRVGGRTTGNNTNWRDSVGIRASASKSYKWLAGTNTLSPGIDTGNNTLGPGHRYRITVDSRITSPSQQVLFKLERRTSSTGSYSTLIDTLNLMAQDQSAPPANLLLSYTGSTGDNTNFHDITNIQVCTQQPSTPIEIGNPVHHIRLDYNPGLTCESNPVTVTACANATCTAPHANLAFVDLDVTYPNSPVTTMRVNLTNGVGTVSLSNTVQGNAAIDVSGNTLQSCNGATPATAACSMYFSDTAFKFYRDDVSTAGLANQVAGVQGGGYLRAVKTNTDTKACEARTEGLKNVAMSFSCINPNNCSIDLEKVLTLKNNRPLATTETFFDGDEEGSVKNVSLNFDEDGYAPLGINYLDVGQLRLSASLSLPANGNDPAVTLTGLSDPFVVRPHRINVTTALSSTTAASPNAVNPQTSDAGAGFVAAGEDFQLYVSPVNALGNLTPNYGNETVAESVEVQFGQLLYPADGVDGTLTADADFDKVDSGAYINRFHSDQVSWNEVGTLTITASVKGSDYLGTGLGAAAVSDPYTVGRFYPADFSLDSSSLSNSCNNFSYMGQPGIGLNYILSARNVDGQVTENYGANFAPKATVALVLEHDDEGTDLAERLNETSGTWQSGVMQIALSTLNFSRLADVTLIDGPFSVLKAGLQISDSIDSRDFKATNKNMNADTQGLCDTACNAVQLSGSLDVRYGRFTLLNGYGPENEDLPIVLQSQYWDGDRFVRNTTDNCSHFTPDKLLVTGITTSKGGTAGNVESGENPYQHLFIPAPNVLGTAELEYEIPEDQEFMQFPWNGVVLGNPTAEAQFGRYRGNKRQIFWQERLN